MIVLWFVEQPHWHSAWHWAERCDQLAAPDFLTVEVANVLWKMARSGDLTAPQASAALDHVRSSGLQLTPTQPLLSGAWRLSQALDHPIYDCLYLTLAEAMRSPMVTADRRFFERVMKSPWCACVRWIDTDPDD